MFDLRRFLDSRRSEVDRSLGRFLPPVTSVPSKLHEAMRYSVLSPGKRLRPVLCLAAAQAAASGDVPDPGDIVMRAAVSIELFHTYTLIHDDLPCMDDDDLRRGRPTCHIVFGEATALLAGDALQCLAFEILATAGNRAVGARLAGELASAGGSVGVVGGQVEDLAAVSARLDEETLSRIHRRKTACLFSAAARMGAIAGGGDDRTVNAVGRFGMAAGLAFQIVDDLLDAGGKKGEAETSCLRVYDASEARRRVVSLTTEALAALDEAVPRASSLPLRAMAEMMTERSA
jgi:geranylgeranyl pyrophosphate synthase